MKLFVLFMLCALCGLGAFAQARWQADVSISSLTLAYATITKQPPILNSSRLPNPTPTRTIAPPASSNVVCNITVHNENDDDAYGTTLVVCLPVEVSVLYMSAGGTTHTASTGTQYIAYISFDLGHMAVGQDNTVTFTYTKSKYTNKVGAFAYSGSPDPNPTNNYKDASIY